MIDKLILRAIEESFELRFLLRTNSEIDSYSRASFEAGDDFKLYFYQEEDSSFKITVRDISDTRIVFGYNSDDGAIQLKESSLKPEVMNQIINLIIQAQEKFKSRKTSKRKLTLN